MTFFFSVFFFFSSATKRRKRKSWSCQLQKKKKKRFKNHLFLPFPFIFSATKDPLDKKIIFFPFISQQPNKALKREIQTGKMKDPENVMLLRCNARIEIQIADRGSGWGWESVRELLIEREKYLANMALTPSVFGESRKWRHFCKRQRRNSKRRHCVRRVQ